MKSLILLSLFLSPVIVIAQNMAIKSVKDIYTLPEGMTLSLPCPKDIHPSSVCVPILSKPLLMDRKSRMHTYVMTNSEKISQEEIEQTFEQEQGQWTSYVFNTKSGKFEKSVINHPVLTKGHLGMHINNETSEVIVNGSKARLFVIDSTHLASLNNLETKVILPRSIRALSVGVDSARVGSSCLSKYAFDLEASSPCIDCVNEQIQASIQEQPPIINLQVLENEVDFELICKDKRYFCGANCKGAGFVLKKKNFKNLPLSGMAFTNSDLEGANFNKSILVRVDFGNSNLNRAQLNRANLEEANFSGAQLNRAQLNRAQLNRANFSGAELKKASLMRANFQRARLKNSNLQEASLRKTNFFNANFRGADLRGADVENTNFMYASFRGADLSNTNLHLARLENARYDSNTIFPRGFDPIKYGMEKLPTPQKKIDPKPTPDPPAPDPPALDQQPAPQLVIINTK